MKRYFVMMAAALLLFSSCGRDCNFAVNLNEETKAVSFEVRREIPVIINKNSMTFHLDADCSYLSRMKDENRMELAVESLDKLLSHSYKACSRCAKETDTQNDILP